jgi:hypothetical protein
MVNSTRQTWTICESEGRWAAALRMLFARIERQVSVPRLYEVRNFTDLSSQLAEHRPALVLLEVRPANLSEVLNTVARDSRLGRRFVAMLDYSVCDRLPSESGGGVEIQDVADALREAGATEVIASPRQCDKLLAVHRCLETMRASAACGGITRQSVEDWARSCLPWQET